jgi:hypothetical protein
MFRARRALAREIPPVTDCAPHTGILIPDLVWTSRLPHSTHSINWRSCNSMSFQREPAVWATHLLYSQLRVAFRTKTARKAK